MNDIVKTDTAPSEPTPIIRLDDVANHAPAPLQSALSQLPPEQLKQAEVLANRAANIALGPDGRAALTEARELDSRHNEVVEQQNAGGAPSLGQLRYREELNAQRNKAYETTEAEVKKNLSRHAEAALGEAAENFSAAKQLFAEKDSGKHSTSENIEYGLAGAMETVKGMFNAGREGFSRIFAFHSADDKVKLVEDTLTGMEEADKRHYNKPESTTPESPLPTPGMKNTITRTK